MVYPSYMISHTGVTKPSFSPDMILDAKKNTMTTQTSPPAPVVPLLPHQELAKRFILTHPFCGIWLKVGGAKTRITLEALSELRPEGHILIIAPLAIARNTWLAEINKWGFDVRVVSLIADDNNKRLTKAQRFTLYQEIPTAPPTLYIINEDLLHDLVKHMPDVRVGGVSRKQWWFPTVIVDESQDFKNPSSRRFKSLRAVRPAITRMIQLTGTPAPHSLFDVWSQIFLLDGGVALGETFKKFREKFFYPTKYFNNRAVQWQAYDEKQIHERFKHLVLSAEHTQIPLPEITYETVKVFLDDEKQQDYLDFRREQVLALASIEGLTFVEGSTFFEDEIDPEVFITADNAAILRGKLLQFASGSLYFGDNHDMDFTVVHNAKLVKLVEILSQLVLARRPVLIAYRYRADSQIIPAFLNDYGIAARVFDGSPGMISEWNDGRIPVMLLQPASFGRGLNLQHGGADLIWYTLPDSLEFWEQTVGRLYRIGQTRTVRVVLLVTADTLDELQPARLGKKHFTQADLVSAMCRECRDDIRSIGRMQSLPRTA